MSNWFGGNLNGEEDAFCVQADVSISDSTAIGSLRFDDSNNPVYIDWGDGTVEYYATMTNTLHSYSDSSRKYLVKVYDAGGSGLAIRITLIPSDDKKYINLISMGSQPFSDLRPSQALFQGATELEGNLLKKSGADFRNLSDTSFSYLFFNTYSFDGDIGAWDVSNVTDMSNMFYGNQIFNQDLGAWDVSNVTNMSNMFVGVGGLTTVQFNNGGSPSIDNWNVSNVSNMSYIFSLCNSFNQPVGSWDVSSVTNMQGMFDRASSFNQDISAWSPATSSANFNSMLNATTAMSGANYSKWLIALANWAYDNSYAIAESLGATNVTYNNTTYTGIGSGTYTDAPSARSYLQGLGWTITDGGLA